MEDLEWKSMTKATFERLCQESKSADDVRSIVAIMIALRQDGHEHGASHLGQISVYQIHCMGTSN